MAKSLQRAGKKLIDWFRWNRTRVTAAMTILGVLILLPAAVYGGVLWLYRDRIYPGVKVADLEVGNYPTSQAWQSVEVLARDYVTEGRLGFTVAAQTASASDELRVDLVLEDYRLRYNPVETVEQAYRLGRGGSWRENLEDQWRLWQEGVVVPHHYSYDQDALERLVATVAAEINRPGAKAQVQLEKVGDTTVAKVYPGEDGWVLDEAVLIAEIEAAWGRLSPILPTSYLIEEDNTVSERQIEKAMTRAKNLIGQELTLELDLEGSQYDQTMNLEDSEIVSFLGFRERYDERQIEDYVETLAEAVEKDPVEALFKFEGGRVVEFAPSAEGVRVVVAETVEAIMTGLARLEAEEEGVVVPLVVALTPPTKATPEVNDLGIQELIGRGTSTYRGSIPGRIHNVALTASRLNGVLVAPGDTFSFNKAIGDVSAATGYKSAYVIKNGRTVLGDGGGVCQDSTTLFRAMMDAGLPIVERKAHAYRVGYYEQDQKPGFDATVYAPSPDLKFLNDTPAHILIQATADTRTATLTIDLYGTSDGREAAITNYQQWDAVPAPPPLYQDDPTLAPGEVKQVDWAAPGLKVKFDYSVTRDGETVFEKTFYSNYRPWQAVYLRGV